MSKKDHIIQSTIEILKQNRQASMADIAEAAGVGRATLFRHFKTRQDIIDMIDIDFIEKKMAAVQTIVNLIMPPKDKLAMMISSSVSLGLAFDFFNYEVLNTNNPKVIEALDNDTNLWCEVIDELREEHEIPAIFSSKWIALSINTLIMQACELQQEQNKTEKEVIELIWTSVTQPMIKL
ncbi:TetR/AcrR family transcriptional regulator [Vibrio nomapromontoriensis]|uniref:TetR/AcrR family transcriptional regulator n=1 Tax=Vibrio nomapromontoriensis TaxID=2910246 RepID=UPI003D09D64B